VFANPAVDGSHGILPLRLGRAFYYTLDESSNKGKIDNEELQTIFIKYD
jgi:hypothetical protein